MTPEMSAKPTVFRNAGGTGDKWTTDTYCVLPQSVPSPKPEAGGKQTP